MILYLLVEQNLVILHILLLLELELNVGSINVKNSITPSTAKAPMSQ